MKPCDVKTVKDYDSLSEKCINHLGSVIEMDVNGVFLRKDPYFTVRFTNNAFRKFAEWYLADQEEK